VRFLTNAEENENIFMSPHREVRQGHNRQSIQEFIDSEECSNFQIFWNNNNKSTINDMR
jgi:hypothetical protein